MRESVRIAFVTFTAQYEGIVPWMYQDVKGLVSTGIGNLIDPVQAAVILPFVHEDGTPAARDEIVAEWLRVKNQPPDAQGRTAAQRGHLYARQITKLKLTPAGIQQVVENKLNQNDAFLRKRFLAFEQWPADAQLATHSMAWACGPAFRFPKLEAALRALDFHTAARECRMDETGNPGLKPRNVANQQLYENAAEVHERHRNPDPLYWPNLLDGPVSPDDETLQDIRLDLHDSEPPPKDFATVTRLPYSDDVEPPDAA